VGQGAPRQDTALAVLIVLLYLPFILNQLWQTGSRAWKLVVLGAALVLAGSGLYNRNYEQQYLVEATDWLHGNVPPRASVLSNNPYIAHFAGHGDPASLAEWTDLADFLDSGTWENHRFLALQLNPGGDRQWTPLAMYPQLDVRQVFDNPAGKMVLLLENKAAEPWRQRRAGSP
jgi:hypothetical protein